jgi:hypothetical protein
MLDNQLGRWMTVDPLADKFNWINPYNYCANNPIFFVYPDGKDITANSDEDKAFVLANLAKVFGVGKFAFKDNKLTFTGEKKEFSGTTLEALNGVLGIAGNSNIQFAITKDVANAPENVKADIKKDANGEGGESTEIAKDKSGGKGYIDDNDNYSTLLFKFRFTYINSKNSDDIKYSDGDSPIQIEGYNQIGGTKLNVVDRNTDGTMKTISSPTVARFFHSIGHMINEGTDQTNVNKYENLIRGILKLLQEENKILYII